MSRCSGYVSWSELFSLYQTYILFEFYTDLTNCIALELHNDCNCPLKTSNPLQPGWSYVKYLHHAILTKFVGQTNPVQTWLVKHYLSESIWFIIPFSAPSSTTVSLRPVCYWNILFIRLCDAWMTQSSNFSPFKIISMCLSSKCSSCIQFFAMCPIKHQIKVGIILIYSMHAFLSTSRVGYTQ